MSHFNQVGVHDPRSYLQAMVTPSGALRIEDMVKLVGTPFQSTRDTNFWAVASSGTGSITYDSGAEKVCAGGSSSNYAYIRSVRRARYMASIPNVFRGVARIDPPLSSERYIIGAVDSTGWDASASGYIYTDNIVFNSGFYFDYSLAYGLSLKARAQNVQVGMVNGSFNGEVQSWENDGKPHEFEIVYWKAGVYFYIDQVLIGFFSAASTGSLAPLGSLGMDLYAFAGGYVPNGQNGDASLVMSVHALNILRMGKEHSVPTWKYITNAAPTGILKRGSGGFLKLINNDNVGSIIIYDDVSAVAGNIVCSVDLTKVFGDLDFNVTLQNGLYYALTGAGKVTVVYE